LLQRAERGLCRGRVRTA
jgi:hypothetical protein